MAEENKVKISALMQAHRNQIEGGFVPVAIPNQKTLKVPLEDFTDPPEIFVAVYGTTTNAQIAAAIADGKLIFANKTETGGVCIAPLSETLTGNIFHFIYAAQDGSREIWEVTSNGWTGDDLPTGIGGVFIDYTLTGSGTKEDPLGINPEEIAKIALGEAADVVDTVRSKILYTMDLGAITGGQFIGGNNFHVHATLFNPNMNQPLEEGSNLLFALNQGEGTQASDIENKRAFLAIYRYDMADNTIHWVANTDNIVSMLGGSGWVAGLKKTTLAKVADDLQSEAKESLNSNKMYYLVLISNCNGSKFVGNAKNENLNTTPYVAFKIDNLKFNDGTTSVTKDNINVNNISTDLAVLTPETEINLRIFAAITNVAIS